MGGIQFQGTQNDVQYCRGLLEYLVVPESDNPKSPRFDSPVASRIVHTAFLVLSAVKLNHKFGVETRKIRDIAADRHLPAESVTTELPTPQMLPKVAFSIRGLISQSATTTLCDRVTHTTDYPAFCPLPNPPPHYVRGRESICVETYAPREREIFCTYKLSVTYCALRECLTLSPSSPALRPEGEGRFSGVNGLSLIYAMLNRQFTLRRRAVLLRALDAVAAAGFRRV